MADPPALSQKGKVIVYISSNNPSTIAPTEAPSSFQTTTPMLYMSKHLFEAIEKEWPTIKNPGKLYCFD